MITILNGKSGLVGALLMVLGLTVLSGLATASDDGTLNTRTADIVSVNLVTGGDATQIAVNAHGQVTPRAMQLADPDRFVVDFTGGILRADTTPIEGDGKLVKSVRVSQFSLSPVPITRLVIDLAAPAQSRVEASETGFVVEVLPQSADASQFQAAEASYPSEEVNGLPADHWQEADNQPRAAQPVRRETDANYARTFSINVQNADIQTVLRSIAEFSGENVISSPDVVGPVTATLSDVPWREALDVILSANGFGYVEEHGVIRVDTLKKLREEEVAKKAATQKIEQLEPLQTKAIRIDFANAEEVKDAMKDVVTNRGSIQVEPRTNSIIVNDIPTAIARVEQMVHQLDSRTPQVHIDAMLLDVDTSVGRDLGIVWSANNLGGADVHGNGSVTAPVENPVGLFNVGTVQDWATLNAEVQALQENNQAQIISNPSITTTDNREATILVGQKIPLIVADEAGNAVTQLTTIGIRLIVTPHINSDNQITLDVHPEVSDLSSQATVQGGVIINTSEADTRVLVNNTQTAVIAGLIRDVESKLTTGVPILMDVPLLGNLFKSTSSTKSKRELMVFITPSIINEGTQMLDQRQEKVLHDLQERKAETATKGVGM